MPVKTVWCPMIALFVNSAERQMELWAANKKGLTCGAATIPSVLLQRPGVAIPAGSARRSGLPAVDGQRSLYAHEICPATGSFRGFLDSLDPGSDSPQDIKVLSNLCRKISAI